MSESSQGYEVKIMVKGYNIVIEASDEVTTIAREVSDILSAQTETCFTLDTTRHIPHVTLYHVSLEEEVVPAVLAALKEVASAMESFHLHQTKYCLVRGQWIDMSYEREDPIVRLHNLVLEAVGQYHVKEEEALQKEEWSDMSPERQENLELYGASEVRGLYRPHLTLTRLVEKMDESILQNLPERNFSFRVSAIALYELGEYGTCHGVLGEFVFDNHDVL